MANEQDPGQARKSGWEFADTVRKMTEHDAPGLPYNFEGRLPRGEQEWGFKIERLPEAPHNLPVQEVFPGGSDQWGDYAALAAVAQQEATRRELNDPKMGRINRQTLGMIYKAMSPQRVDPETYTSKVSEAYEIEAWGHSVRLYNFFGQRLNDDQLSQVANALRAVGEISGGKVFEQLTQIDILPDGHPTLIENSSIRQFSREDKPRSDPGLAASFADGHDKRTLLALNSKLLAPRTPQEPPKSVTEIPSQLPYHPNPRELEDSLVHELMHVLGQSNPEGEKAFRSTEIGPSQYSKKDHREDLAETGTAMHAGGDWSKLVGPQHQELFKATMAKMHSRAEGPTHVTCRELDLRDIAAGGNPAEAA